VPDAFCSLNGILQEALCPLFRQDHIKAVAGSDPGVTCHAAHGIEAGLIDVKLLNQILAYVEANDLAQHNHAAARLVAGLDHLQELALHLGGRLGDSGRTNGIARSGRQPGERELVHFRWHIG